MAAPLTHNPAASVVGPVGGNESTTGKEETPLSTRAWKGRIAACKRDRRERVLSWAENVDFRRGKPFQDDSDVDRINVNIDWALTKAKHAQLFSKMPTVLLTAENEQFKPSVPAFQKALNKRLQKGRVNSAMNETIVDCVNAAGVAAVIVSYNTLEVPKTMPLSDPLAASPTLALEAPPSVPPDGLMEAGLVSPELPSLDPMAMESELMGAPVMDSVNPETDPLAAQAMPDMTVPQILDKQFLCERFSPSDLLWPLDFSQSDFDAAWWIGRSGKLSWHDGKRQFNLQDEDKDKICKATNLIEDADEDNLRQDTGAEAYSEEQVSFDEVYYKRHHFAPDAKSFDEIWRIVFVSGLDEPVVHEHWKGQQYSANGKLVGALKYPIRVLTLTYISDDAIPPSDSAIGRPQVLAIIKGRQQYDMQRDRSLPIRWFDVNRVDVGVQENLMRGTWQGMVPVNGAGERAIGEVARATFPNEDFQFDQISKNDLNEQWQIGANQMGAYASGERSAREAGIIQQNFQTRIAVERARTSDFYVSIAEVMAGLMALYDDFNLVNLEAIQAVDSAWDRTQFSTELVYSIRPDSSVLLDAQQRIAQLERALNLTGQSGFVNPKPIIEEIIGLSDLDPSKIVIDPVPQEPAAPQISYRFSGAADLSSPVVMAMLVEEGRAPSPESLTAALKILQAAGVPANPLGIDPTAEADPQANPASAEKAPPKGPAHPDWGLQPRVAKRTEDIGS